ncbi:MAG TPA: CHAT domain-containing protein, partial [Candidatus Polarisedimenticolaceae bacterium]|nr:CHAT domain-containing protein [Candidatus Polarisedimenticolaceae bacterium]
DRINREHARTIGRFLPENEALSVVSTRWTHGLDLAIGHAISGGDAEVRRRTWDALVRSRALALDTLASRHAVEVRTTDPEVERLAADVESARARLASVTVRDREQDPRARRIAIDEALGEKQRAERAFAARSAALAQQRERSSVGLERVMASLPPSSALVAYITSWDSDAYVAFVVRSGESAPAVVRLGAAEEIDRLVGEWRRLLTKAPEEVGAEARARAAGERLRHRIWDPLRAHVAHARRVFVVPDGSLNAVSFSALPSGPDRYLVEDGPILHYLSAERDLVPLEEPRRGEGLLVVGGPNYDDTSPEPVAPVVASGRTYRGSRSSCESFQRMRFAPLPESDKEARRLVEIWSAARQAPAQRLGGEAASEAAFKRLAPGRRVLHLATHAFLLGGACGSPNDTTPWIAGEDPLLLSGLALAGANHRDTAGPNDEDGILTAEEIAALDLSGVEWAVLSACDTASGDFRMGEGVLGLQRAFRIAGARTLVMSLWPVDDRETRHFMEELYERRLRRGLDTAQAVRGAMLSVLADRRLKGLDTHPFHWAGFLASGDWR